jgi:DNA topoisomerase-1
MATMRTRFADLRYIATDSAGFSRRRAGRSFAYYDTDGQIIRDRETRRWIQSIGIPPAWTDVWISPNRDAHILAVGRDAKGRKQYRYHPQWNRLRSQKKFDLLASFGKHLPRLRETTSAHLRQPRLSRERVLAALVRLLEHTLIRIGNDEYARTNESYGLTTMHDDHVSIEGSRVTFDFVGKSGKAHTITLRDPRLARIVRQCRDIPGQRLFQYLDSDGESRSVDSGDVNAYLREVTGQPFTAKVFRTWGGSTLAIKYLCENCAESASEKEIQACVTHVSEVLGNTKTVCRNYYIHPLIVDAHLEGRLMPLYAQAQQAKFSGLHPEEKVLMSLLKEAGRPKKKAGKGGRTKQERAS